MRYGISPITVGQLGLETIGDKNHSVDKVAGLANADSSTITFYKGDDVQKLASIEVGILIVNSSFTNQLSKFKSKAIVFSDNPMLTFAQIVADNYENTFGENISKDFRESANVKIASSAHIEKSVVFGRDCIIYPNVSILRNTSFGINCTVQSGSVIGGIGMSYVKEKMVYHKLVHLGNVEIADNVDIGTNTSVLTGILETTKIGKGSKIGHNVNIGHNVSIGENCYISSGTTIGGACNIGDNSWISPGVAIVDHVNVGENSKIGVGSVIIKDVLPNSFYLGNPARKISKVK